MRAECHDVIEFSMNDKIKNIQIDADILNLISKYRTTLMGIAVLWVILHHCDCNAHCNLGFLYAFPLLNIGYSGVDIFLFLSGFGIYYSLNKMPDVAKFLLKRFIRFLPAIPIIIAYLIFSKIVSFHVIVGFFTFENFWIRDDFVGYLSYAFFLYLLSPLLKNIIDNHIKSDVNKFCLFIIALFILTVAYWGTEQLVGISRILIYSYGMFLGYSFCNKNTVSKKFLLYSIILSVLGFIMLLIVFLKFGNIRHYYGLIWYPNLLFIPGLCYMIVIIIDKLKNYINLFLNILNILGKYSLTIYCIDYYITTCLKLEPFWHHLFLSLLLGIIYGKLYDILFAHTKSRFVAKNSQ